MCPVCGTLLELSDSPQANRERVFIHKLIAEGRSKQQIKDALVAEYGPAVLATPQASGFDLTAYLVPIIAALVAATALVVGVRRWRRSARPEEPEPEPAAPGDEDAERLVQRLQKGRWVRIEGAGHTVQGDNPADLLIALRGFLDEVAPRGNPGP